MNSNQNNSYLTLEGALKALVEKDEIKIRIPKVKGTANYKTELVHEDIAKRVLKKHWDELSDNDKLSVENAVAACYGKEFAGELTKPVLKNRKYHISLEDAMNELSRLEKDHIHITEPREHPEIDFPITLVNKDLAKTLLQNHWHKLDDGDKLSLDGAVAACYGIESLKQRNPDRENNSYRGGV